MTAAKTVLLTHPAFADVTQVVKASEAKDYVEQGWIKSDTADTEPEARTDLGFIGDENGNAVAPAPEG